ncbi:ABC transporter permease [Reyranella sp. CPCC 100927]|uniref:ABC transporter permease n=1 Tax=Reyranella sp. CPCC 100927 TaxID=2599616 RepID=UPI0011B6FD9B|nr:ABC transporter permease [Reyranella sp. CPCC 100927]TWT10175.1 ABC transporter permease [Reyranella sp. CPCC 100927]
MAFVDLMRRAADSDIWYSFKSSHVVVVATVVTLFIFAMAFLAPILAPHTPFDPATLSLSDALKPPVLTGEDGADWAFPLGTDEQGRDVLSSIMYGTRLSLVVGILATIFSMVLGIALGLISGYVGGGVDAFIMRLADVQLTFPALLVALLIDGVVRGLISVQRHDEIALYVIIGAIGLSFWVQYARTVRGSVLVEKSKEYVQAARVIGLSPVLIMIRHVLPNVMGPVLVIATINIGLAVLTEATLSFLGVGLPSTQPSLGTLIRLGQEVLLSGTWWIVIFPGVTLAILVVAVNLMGDWLRDALNPKLR